MLFFQATLQSGSVFDFRVSVGEDEQFFWHPRLGFGDDLHQRRLKIRRAGGLDLRQWELGGFAGTFTCGPPAKLFREAANAHWILRRQMRKERGERLSGQL